MAENVKFAKFSKNGKKKFFPKLKKKKKRKKILLVSRDLQKILFIFFLHVCKRAGEGVWSGWSRREALTIFGHPMLDEIFSIIIVKIGGIQQEFASALRDQKNYRPDHLVEVVRVCLFEY